MRGFGGSKYNSTQPPRGNPYNQQQGGGRGRFGGGGRDGGRDGGRNYGGGGRGGNQQQQSNNNPFSTGIAGRGNQQQQPRGFPTSQQSATVAVNPFSSNQPQSVQSFQNNSNHMMAKPPSGAVKVAANPFAAGSAASQNVFASSSNSFANQTPPFQQQQQPSSSPFLSQPQQQPSVSNNPFSSGNSNSFPSMQNQQQSFPPRPVNQTNNPFQSGYQQPVASSNPFTSGGGASFPPKAPQVSSNNPFTSSSSQQSTSTISTEKVKSDIKSLDFKSVLANKTTDFHFDVPSEVPGSASGMLEGDSMKDDNNTSFKELEVEGGPEATEILQINEEPTGSGNENIIDDGLIRWMDNFPLKEYLSISDELINPFKYLNGQLVPGRIPAAVP
jgi:hypothetical protein